MKMDRISLGMILAVLLATLAAYPWLPSRVPYHWDFTGRNDAMGPTWVVLIPVAVAIAVYLLFAWLPKTDRSGNLQSRERSYRIVTRSVVGVVVLFQLAMLAVALQWPVSMSMVFGVVLGLLLVVIGNLFPTAKPNPIFGIRTPWTMRDEETWRVTHRFGGRLTVVAGALLTVASLFIPGSWVVGSTLAIVLLLLVATTLYSWVDYRGRKRGL